MTSNFASINYGYDANAILKCRDESTCTKWQDIIHKNFQQCDIKGKVNQNGNYVFNGCLKDYLAKLSNNFDIFVQYWAPNKAANNYSGKVLVYPNEEIAYEGTCNKGVSKTLDKEFTFTVENPNSYYTQMGKKLNNPLVKFRFCDGNGKILSNIYTIELHLFS